MNDRTEELLAERGRVYGDAVSTHARIGEAWSAVLGHPVSAHEVALCMVALKIIRAACAPDHQDSYDDIRGYTAIAEQIVEVWDNEPA